MATRVINIKTVICQGRYCTCCDVPLPEPDDPPEPGCDMECLNILFQGPYTWRFNIGNPPFIIGSIDFTRSYSPGHDSQICDQDSIIGTVTAGVSSTIPDVDFEIFESLDTSNAIWTVTYKSHSNGDIVNVLGGNGLVVQMVWQYNAGGVTPGDLIGDDVDCCLVAPDIGLAFLTDNEYHLVNGPGSYDPPNEGTISVCGVYVFPSS